MTEHMKFKLKTIAIALMFSIALVGKAYSEEGFTQDAATENPVAQNKADRPAVIVYPSATVQKSIVTLGDISRIVSRAKNAQQLVEKLQAIKIADAPAPKASTSISGLKVLSAIQEAGIDPSEFAYSIPPAVNILRDGRVVTSEEVIDALKSKLLTRTDFDVQIKGVQWATGQIVPVGESEIKVEALGEPSGGKLPVRVAVFVDKAPAARFLATATVDDWREVPVLNKGLDRGMLITSEDIELVRLNLHNQPEDVVSKLDEVVGRRTKTKVGAGETIRKSLVDIPPTIPRGKKIAIEYNSGLLFATASGVAMEDGFSGQTIKVRNIASKKIIEVKVVNEETVEVSAP
jgi:flagella basal body P-ring formation protein FlgA